MKTCNKCLKEYSADFFYTKLGKNGKVYVRGTCKDCHRKMVNLNYPKYTIKIAAGRRKRLYGITQDQYEILSKKQSGLCAICKRNTPLCVDHNHQTGAIRGLLCNLCNRGIGHFGDDLDLLTAAISYLTMNN